MTEWQERGGGVMALNPQVLDLGVKKSENKIKDKTGKASVISFLTRDKLASVDQCLLSQLHQNLNPDYIT